MTEDNTSQDGGDFSGSMEELVARGGNYRCTFSHQSDTDDSSGTIYISGSSIRGDFVSLIQRINVESHMIQSGGYIYTWSSTMPTGFKLKVATTTEAGGTAIPGQYSDVDQTYSYDCESWSPDNSKFSIPSTITFKELGQ
jgi:hypothetical protein